MKIIEFKAKVHQLLILQTIKLAMLITQTSAIENKIFFHQINL